MKKTKTVTKTVILNGTKVWLTVLSIICTYGGGSIWWAAAQTTTLHEVKTAVSEIKTDLDKKADLSALVDLRADFKDYTRGK
jgi:hypothetical protein